MERFAVTDEDRLRVAWHRYRVWSGRVWVRRIGTAACLGLAARGNVSLWLILGVAAIVGARFNWWRALPADFRRGVEIWVELVGVPGCLVLADLTWHLLRSVERHPNQWLVGLVLAALVAAWGARKLGWRLGHRDAGVTGTLAGVIAGVLPGCKADQVRVGLEHLDPKKPSFAGLARISASYPANVPMWRSEVQEHLRDALEFWLKSHTTWPSVSINHVRAGGFVARPGQPRRELPARLMYPLDGDEAAGEIGFATTLDGHAVAWDLNSSSPHALVVGGTGSGKSVVLTTMAISAVRRGISVVILDPKRASLQALRGFPGVEYYAETPGEITAALSEVEAEVDARYRKIKAGVPARDLAPLLVVIDEYVSLADRIANDWKRAGGKGEAPGVTSFRQIVRVGRQARVHVLLATQRPDAHYLPGETRDQLGCRVVVGRAKDATRRMVEVESEVLDDLPGRAVVQLGSDEEQVQIWWPGVSTGKLENPSEVAHLAPAVTPAAVLNVSDLGVSGFTKPDETFTKPLTKPDETVMKPDETFDLTAEEAAEIAGVTPQAVGKAAAVGRLTRVKRGRNFFYSRAEVEALAPPEEAE